MDASHIGRSQLVWLENPTKWLHHSNLYYWKAYWTYYAKSHLSREGSSAGGKGRRKEKWMTSSRGMDSVTEVKGSPEDPGTYLDAKS